jgi:hypothetical protein
MLIEIKSNIAQYFRFGNIGTYSTLVLSSRISKQTDIVISGLDADKVNWRWIFSFDLTVAAS